MRAISLAWTTNTAGAATTIGESVVGKVYAIRYIPGDTDTGATVTVTSESDSSFPLLAKATAGTSNVTFYPRVLVNGNTGTVVTGTAVSGRVRVGDRLRLSPSGLEVRVRGLHAQNQAAEEGLAGQRLALNLVGAKGAGEAGSIGSCPAVMNALVDALDRERDRGVLRRAASERRGARRAGGGRGAGLHPEP